MGRTKVSFTWTRVSLTRSVWCCPLEQEEHRKIFSPHPQCSKEANLYVVQRSHRPSTCGLNWLWNSHSIQIYNRNSKTNSQEASSIPNSDSKRWLHRHARSCWKQIQQLLLGPLPWRFEAFRFVLETWKLCSVQGRFKQLCPERATLCSQKTSRKWTGLKKEEEQTKTTGSCSCWWLQSQASAVWLH